MNDYGDDDFEYLPSLHNKRKRELSANKNKGKSPSPATTPTKTKTKTFKELTFKPTSDSSSSSSSRQEKKVQEKQTKPLSQTQNNHRKDEETVNEKSATNDNIDDNNDDDNNNSPAVPTLMRVSSTSHGANESKITTSNFDVDESWWESNIDELCSLDGSTQQTQPLNDEQQTDMHTVKQEDTIDLEEEGDSVVVVDDDGGDEGNELIVLSENESISEEEIPSNTETETEGVDDTEVFVVDGKKPTFLSNIISTITQKTQSTLDKWLGNPKPLQKSPPLPKNVKTPTPRKTRSYSRSSSSSSSNMRPYPFYKRVEGTHFFVDSFNYDCTIEDKNKTPQYFLTHFHSDHYQGLRKSFNKGRIYCSQITYNLILHKMGVSTEYLFCMDYYLSYIIDGITVIALDANHCPGAVMFLFILPNGKRILHVGDFRYHRKMLGYSALQSPLDIVYLDTTYCNPSYAFLDQDIVIEHGVKIVDFFLNQCTIPTLVLIGTYTIGKERLLMRIAEFLGVKVFVQPWKYKILQCLNFPELDNWFTTEPTQAPVHVLPIGSLSFLNMVKILKQWSGRYKQIIGIKPTGWTHGSSATPNKSKRTRLIKPSIYDQNIPSSDLASCERKGNLSIYGLPYSEHSSFSELREFVATLKPRKIIPTVNNSSHSKVKEMIDMLTS